MQRLSVVPRWLALVATLAAITGAAAPGGLQTTPLPQAAVTGAASPGALQATLLPQAAPESASELRLDAALIEEFLSVIYFRDAGRFNFREYSTCSYEFVQNPRVTIEDGLVRVSGDYYRRRATEALGGCVGGLGMDAKVVMTARLSAQDSKLLIEVLEITTDTMPELTGMILQMSGLTLPLAHEFDLMGALNGILYENQPFGVSSLQIHDVRVDDASVRLRLTMKLGIW